MITVTCDNCDKKLKSVISHEDSKGPIPDDGTYERRVNLRMTLDVAGDLADMDYCPKCAREVISLLKMGEI